jgi:cysteine desulfurase/selenocysteine lyase
MKKIRQDFPILQRKLNDKPLIYLDNAATSQKPKSVIKAIKDYYEQHNANVHRGIHTLSEESSRLYQEAREKVAKFIGARAEELIFTKNTTEGINLVAWAWARKQLKPGDEIISTLGEHHSNFLPWQELKAAKGIKLNLVGLAQDGRLNLKEFESQLSTKTRLVAVGQMSNVTGIINPVKRIVSLAKRVGARVLLDGAQSVAHLRVDVKDLGCDFLAFSGHKMLGPMGIGGLYVKKEVQEEIGEFLTGGGMVLEVHKKRVVWAEGVERFEAGTPNVAGAVGLKAAVEYLEKVGMDRVEDWEKQLTAYLLKRLEGNNLGLVVVGPLKMKERGGIVSFVVKGIHAHDVAQVLDSEGIAVRSGFHCAQPLHDELKLPATVRVSFYLYNTRAEVDRLLLALAKLRKIFT